MALNPGAMHDRIIANLPEKTGHALSHWIERLNDAPGDRKGRVAQLKAAGLGHHTAVAVVREAEGDVPWRDGMDLEANLIARLSPKARTLYDDLRTFALKLPGTTAVPCKGYTGFKAARQFMILRPAGDGLEVGLALQPATDPALTPAKGFGSERIAAKAGMAAGRNALVALISKAHSEA